LRQEHLALAEEIADDIHAGHQRPSITSSGRLEAQARLLDIGVDVIGDAIHQRIFEPLVDA